jgi:hypothetical protein
LPAKRRSFTLLFIEICEKPTLFYVNGIVGASISSLYGVSRHRCSHQYLGGCVR